MNAWEDYVAAQRQNTAAPAPGRVQDATAELIAAAADLDGAAAGRARDAALETLTGDARAKRCIGDPNTREPAGCWYTGVGLGLHEATVRLQNAVQQNKDMTDEDREALALAIGGVFNSLGELAGDIEDLEGD